jgi:hypothetical protein
VRHPSHGHGVTTRTFARRSRNVVVHTTPAMIKKADPIAPR